MQTNIIHLTIAGHLPSEGRVGEGKSEGRAGSKNPSQKEK